MLGGRSRRSRGTAMRTFALLTALLSISTSGVANEARRCTRGKLRAATKYVQAYYDCYADAAAVGTDPGFTCLTAASDAVRALVAGGDARGPCPGTPDQVANAICVPFLPAGDPACRAAKYRAAGWKFARRLACLGNGLQRGAAPRPGCFARVEAGFVHRLARADAVGSCGGDAAQLEGLIDRCALTMESALSCGNGRLDYGEICEVASDFCGASCQPVGGACCVAAGGCFQFGGPIENCFLAGGFDILPGFCTAAGCVGDISISTTSLCCQQTGAACTDAVASTASQLSGLAATCGSTGSLAVVGTCGTDGRCVPASEPPVALTTTTVPPSTTTSTVPGTTTTTVPSAVCVNIGGACGQCGNGTCMEPLAGTFIGACVVPGAVGPCAPTPPPCGENEVCITS